MQPYRLIDALSKALAYLQILRSEPATNAFNLKIGVEAVRKVLVVSRITDEAGVEL